MPISLNKYIYLSFLCSKYPKIDFLEIIIFLIPPETA